MIYYELSNYFSLYFIKIILIKFVNFGKKTSINSQYNQTKSY